MISLLLFQVSNATSNARIGLMVRIARKSATVRMREIVTTCQELAPALLDGQEPCKYLKLSGRERKKNMSSFGINFRGKNGFKGNRQKKVGYPIQLSLSLFFFLLLFFLYLAFDQSLLIIFAPIFFSLFFCFLPPFFYQKSNPGTFLLFFLNEKNPFQPSVALKVYQESIMEV